MKISVNWLKDYTHFDYPSNDVLLEKITQSICEVEHFTVIGESFNQICVAQINSIEKHPQADQLSLVELNTGSEKVSVVCGANNLELNTLVTFAPVGTKLEDGTLIVSTTIRGVESNGMICSEKELSLSDEHDRILILPASSKIGEKLKNIYPDHQDVILDIDNKSITHRPDLWGHYGFAREIAVLFDSQFNSYQTHSDYFKSSSENGTKIHLDENIKDVLRFSGINISGVEVKPSTDKVKHRLHRVGLNSINNLVDITNYVMLDIGQPMHAFDKNNIVGNELTVRYSTGNEKLITLKEQEITLTKSDIAIFDQEKATSLAGIMGGLTSSIQDNTNELYLEAANWHSTVIRKTSLHHGIRSDASQRFEKSLDPEMTLVAISKAIDALKETCPNLTISSQLFDQFNTPYPPRKIKLTYQKINHILGADISKKQIHHIFEALGFGLKTKENEMEIDVPSWRNTKDIELKEDLIEEIGRMYDYNNIVAKPPTFPIQAPADNSHKKQERITKQFLMTQGYSEIYTYPIVDNEWDDKLGIVEDNKMVLLNPVNHFQTQMRTNLYGSNLNALLVNQKHADQFQFFEIGKCYSRNGNESKEHYHLYFTLYQKNGNLNEIHQKILQDLLKLLMTLGIQKVDLEKIKTTKQNKFMHPYACTSIYFEGKVIAEIYTLNKKLLHQFQIKQEFYTADLNFSLLYEITKRQQKFVEIPAFPPVFFDISLLVDQYTYFADIKKKILSVDDKIIDVKLKDIFYPENHPDKKSMTFSITFQDLSKTIDSNEVKIIQDAIVAQLEKQGLHLR